LACFAAFLLWKRLAARQGAKKISDIDDAFAQV